MPLKKFPVTLPTIYDKFQCKGGACRNTCCQVWNIDVSRAEYNKIRHQCNSETAQTLFKRMPRKLATDMNYARVVLNEEGFCPFFNTQGLCGLQVEYGYQILPKICKQFPRIAYCCNHESSFSYCLDTGCERTLELLWAEQEHGLRFITEPRDINLVTAEPLKSDGLYEYTEDIRNLCIWLLQNRSYSLSDRMLIIGLAIRELQEIQDSNTPERVPAWFLKWQAHTKGNTMAAELAQITGNHDWFVRNNLKMLFILKHALSNSLSYLVSILSETISFDINGAEVYYDIPKYTALQEQFFSHFPKIEQFFENYMVFTFFRQSFPFQVSVKSVWESYMYQCNIYSLLRFISITAAPQNAEDLIDILTAFSRDSINCKLFNSISTTEMTATSSSSLAHMAVLLRG